MKAWSLVAYLLMSLPALGQQGLGEIRQLAQQGDAKAQYKLGKIFSLGVDVQQSDAEALKWYRLAAEQGYAEGQVALATIYLAGKGVPKNPAEAMRLYRMAAEQGSASAYHALGDAYWHGWGVPQNDEDALSFYRKAAEQGHAEAMRQLGLLFYKDEKIRHFGAAAHWFTLYAKSDRNQWLAAPAAEYLGLMYYSGGPGLLQDFAEAARWWRLGSELGHADQQYRLGLMIAAGEAGERDLVQAYMWLNLAVANSIFYRDAAREARDDLAREMTPAQVIEAQRLAREWKTKTWEELKP